MSSGELKRTLEDIDAKIVELIAQRHETIKDAVGQEDAEKALSSDAGWDSEVLQHVKSLAGKRGLDTDELENIYRQILAGAKKLKGIEVAFLGEDGSFGQEVAFGFFGRSVKTRQCDTIEEVYNLVQQGKLEHGIVPVENSQEGSIGQSYDLLLESDVTVCGEVQIRTTYCLAANKSASLGTIKKIYSHPQALGECQAFLRHLGCDLIPTYHTVGTAKMIKDKRLTDSAIVAGEGVAFAHDMKILAREIEDNRWNSTRFFLLGKQDVPPTGNDKTSIVTLLKHEPGTLFGIIKEFADREINLTKVETRPTRKTPWEYHFYIDFEGHRKDPVIREALDRVEKACLFLKVLGSYPRAKAH
ncbi:MAG: bifunctional chorismate mutase/prephenate dehydratase [Dehalococcoidia bacterium]|nr:bifunctional chorismate mutase/prephenate dehydratase [Dehalococcoidia bacterium]MDD5493604.1 bifunctional chorismate mutase/prephenate dehydratase [Dehalococcoidia bacterium]